MPYKIEKRDGKECVVKEGGEVKHCYSGDGAHSQALAYMRALYRAEGEKKEVEALDKELADLGLDTKEIEALTQKCMGGYVPWGVKSWAELDAWKGAQETAEEIGEATVSFNQMVQNIMNDPEWGMNEKLAAVKELADGLPDRVSESEMDESKEQGEEAESAPPGTDKENESGLVERVLHRIKELFGLSKADKEKEPSGFMVYKEQDGSYRWIARYSNHYRDQDNPPEIISSQSHQGFVERVEKGLAPLPELWLWHVKEWRVGQADWVAFDPDHGFAVAGGRPLVGMEPVFEHLATLKELRVSHGMPKHTIVRDETDESIIIEHETREISPLPAWAAANKLTGFVVLDNEHKEATMAIPADKRETLIKEYGFSEALLAQIEAANAKDAEKAKDEGLEAKETATAEPVTDTPAEQPAQAEPVAVPAEPAAPAEPPAADKAIVELVGLVKALTEKVAAMEQKQKADGEELEKAANTLGQTPVASILSMFKQGKSAIGAEETQVDGRTSLAKSKPAEAKQNVEGRTLVPFINTILAGQSEGQQ